MVKTILKMVIPKSLNKVIIDDSDILRDTGLFSEEILAYKKKKCVFAFRSCLDKISPFTSSYFCEKGFSFMIYI